MTLDLLNPELKNSIVEVEGFATVNREIKDGKNLLKFSIRQAEDNIYFRINEGDKMYNKAKNLSSNVKIKVSGKMGRLKAAGDAYNYLVDIDEIEKDESSNQIWGDSSSKSFVEILKDGFDIGKVHFNFFAYDYKKESGDKIVNTVPIYLNPDIAFGLCSEILDGTIARNIEIEKRKKLKDSSYYYKPAFEARAGTSHEELANRGQAREDGKDIYRIFSIEPSNSDKNAFILVAKSGPAKKQGNIYIPDGAAENIIRVPLTSIKAKGMAQILKNHLSGIINNSINLKNYKEIMEAIKVAQDTTTKQYDRILSIVTELGLKIDNIEKASIKKD